MALSISSSTLRPCLLPLFLFCSTSTSAQQAPNPYFQIPAFSDPPVYQGNGNRTTFRNNVCHLAAQRLTEEVGLANILQDVELHSVLMLNEYANMDYEYDSDGNLVNMTLNEEYPGLVPLLMDELCQRAGCTWRDSYVAYGYNVLAEQEKSFDDWALWSTSTFDVNLDWWMRSVSRLRDGITFTEKWYDGSIIMVTKKASAQEEQKKFDPLSWLLPFDNNVWFMTIGTIFFSAAVYWFLEILNPKADGEESRLDTFEAIWMFATAFTGQFEFDPQTHPARLFTFSIAFWALLMSAAYTANLASFLVVANTPQNPIENLNQAVRASLPMCVWRSSQTDTSVTTAFPAYAGSGLLKRLDSQKELFLGVQEGLCDIAITEISSWEAFQYNSEVHADCNLQWIGRAFEFIPASFVMTNDAGDLCTSLLRAVFDLHLHDMEREGIIADLWEGHIEQTATVFCTEDQDNNPDRLRRYLMDGTRFRRLKAANNAAAEAGGFDDNTQLSLANMGGVFLLHAILSVISILCAMIAWYREKSKSSTSDDTADTNDGEKEMAPPKGGAFFGSRAESVTSDAFFDASEGKNSLAAVELLRADMTDKLQALEDKLEKLIAFEKRKEAIADQGMRLDYT